MRVINLLPSLLLRVTPSAWEQRRLGELFTHGGSGGTPSAANQDYYGGDIPFLGISDIDGRSITSTAKSITRQGLDSSAAWIVPSGSVCLAMYASVGKVAISRVNLATSQAFYNMVFDDDALRDFVYSRLDKADAEHEWEPLISTGAQANLNAEKVKGFRLQVPERRERASIASLFSRLDDLIALHQRKLDALRTVRKSLFESALA